MRFTLVLALKRSKNARDPRFHVQISEHADTMHSQSWARRRPPWRGRGVLHTEVEEAVMSLKLARGNPAKASELVATKVSRMVMQDHLAVLSRLHRLDETELAYMVYQQAQKESWYKPKLSLHRDMLKSLAKKGYVNEVYKLLEKIQKDNLELQMVLYVDLIEILADASMFDDALRMYELMKQSECPPNCQAYGTIINKFRKLEQFDISERIDQERKDYIERTFGSDSTPPLPPTYYWLRERTPLRGGSPYQEHQQQHQQQHCSGTEALEAESD